MNLRSNKKKKHLHVGDPCHYCFVPMTVSPSNGEKPLPTAATEEHIILKSKKGARDSYNIVMACSRCNNLRADHNYEIFEMFARIVIRKYPNTPTPYLRLALNQFIRTLAEIAISNGKESRRAIGVALLSITEHLKGRDE